jgi:hypothetical protein
MPGPGIPEIRLDGKRQFRGDPQLTPAEIFTLGLIREAGLQLIFTRQGAEYRSGRRTINRRTAIRLIERHYVIVDNPGLFANGPAQSWMLRPDEPDEKLRRLGEKLRQRIHLRGGDTLETEQRPHRACPRSGRLLSQVPNGDLSCELQEKMVINKLLSRP